MAIIPGKCVSEAVGELGRKFGIASLPLGRRDEASKVARRKGEAREALAVQHVKVAEDAAKQLANAVREIEEMGGEVELAGSQAIATLAKLQNGIEAAKRLIFKIKHGGLSIASRGHFGGAT